MARFRLNGVEFEGNMVDIVGRNIFINGQKVAQVEAGETALDIHILEGTLGELKADGNVVCQNVTGSVDAGGSITVNGSVGAKCDAGGTITVMGNVAGNLDAGGSIKVGGAVQGKMNAGGSINVGR